MDRDVRASKTSSNSEHRDTSARLSLPVSAQYRRTVRRSELRQMVPLADTTIYEMERRGDFPKRFNLTVRCVVWDLAEVETWLAERRLASEQAQIKRAPSPDVRQRKTRPVKSPASS